MNSLPSGILPYQIFLTKVWLEFLLTISQFFIFSSRRGWDSIQNGSFLLRSSILFIIFLEISLIKTRLFNCWLNSVTTIALKGYHSSYLLLLLYYAMLSQMFLAGNQLYELKCHRIGWCGCPKKSIAIFGYKQWVLSIEMKTKLVQHVENEWMRDWKSVRVRKSERLRESK